MLTTNDTKLETKASYLAVEYLGGGKFNVASGSAHGAVYLVEVPERGADWRTWRCSCNWARHGGHGCAHVRAARMKAESMMARRGKRTVWQGRRERRLSMAGAPA